MLSNTGGQLKEEPVLVSTGLITGEVMIPS